MQTRYAPIPARLMRAGTIVRQPAIDTAARVQPGDPAISVMTDLRQVPAVLVDPEIDIEAALCR